MTMRSLSPRLLLRSGLVTAAVILTGCPERTAVWLEEGQSIGDATFVLGRSSGSQASIPLRMARVDRCEDLVGPSFPPADQAVWAVLADEDPPLLSSLRFGELPEGLREIAPPLHLRWIRAID